MGPAGELLPSKLATGAHPAWSRDGILLAGAVPRGAGTALLSREKAKATSLDGKNAGGGNSILLKFFPASHDPDAAAPSPSLPWGAPSLALSIFPWTF